MLRALDRKLIRDLWNLRGQVIALAMVIACGVAVMVMSLSTQQALLESADAYYDRYAFGDVFAVLKRAPNYIADRVAGLEGVQSAESRVMKFATLDVPGVAEPVLGQFVSVPESGQPLLNQLVIRFGRSVSPGQPDEVILNEPFAEAHGLRPGDRIAAILNGHRRNLLIVGIALSPEFVYSLGPGALMPDDIHFGVLWMGEKSLKAAFDLQESFNSLSLMLAHGTLAEDVIPAVDQILERYGGAGAIARADQMSNWFVMNEIEQLGSMSVILPAIFLFVSAFLTHMVMGRLVATERSQIGLMKAFGYSSFDVSWHYAKLVIVIGAMGILFGLVAGSYIGRMNTEMYAEIFRFPFLLYHPSARAFVVAGSVTLIAALAGAMGSVRSAAMLAPAQAMIPPRPPVFRRSRLAKTRVGQFLDQPTRIILRNMARSPVRSIMTAGGVAASVGLLVLALQWKDALDHLAATYFFEAQRQDLMIGFAEPQGSDIIHEVSHLPGVLAAEPLRIVSADLMAGPVRHRGSVAGVIDDARLQPVFDENSFQVIGVPRHGIVLSTRLAEKLGVGVGDRIWVDVREGRRPEIFLTVAALFETYIGMPAFMHIDTLNHLLRERPSVEYFNLLVDSIELPDLYQQLKLLPSISAVMLRRSAVESFNDAVAENMLVFITLFSAFAAVLGFGVTYNAARIALSERGRDLATLRVLGFTRGEISYILLGEILLLIVLALPFGCVLGWFLANVMAVFFDTELFRIPLVVDTSTYGYAGLLAIGSTLLSAAIVRGRVDRLNLLSVLKTRE